MKRWRSGFSLIELLIVIAIIAIMAAVVVPEFLRHGFHKAEKRIAAKVKAGEPLAAGEALSLALQPRFQYVTIKSEEAFLSGRPVQLSDNVTYLVYWVDSPSSQVVQGIFTTTKEDCQINTPTKTLVIKKGVTRNRRVVVDLTISPYSYLRKIDYQLPEYPGPQ